MNKRDFIIGLIALAVAIAGVVFIVYMTAHGAPFPPEFK